MSHDHDYNYKEDDITSHNKAPAWSSVFVYTYNRTSVTSLHHSVYLLHHSKDVYNIL